MPNWVYNRMTITGGSDNALEQIAESLKGDRGDGEISDLTFQRIIPRPIEEEDWYNWNIANWGTKWDASDITVSADEGALHYTFSTAWSPPEPIYAAISNANPELEFRFVYEEEQGWGASIEAKAGILTKIKEWDIPISHAEIVERGGECYCEHAVDQMYKDCYAEQAKVDKEISSRVREAAVSLGNDWQGSYEELIVAARLLSSETNTVKRT
jgi:hypothetical protein